MILHNPLLDDNDNPRESERRRDEALKRSRQRWPGLITLIQRNFILEILFNGPTTSDAVRKLVPIPRGIDPRVVGSAVRGLAESKLIVSVGRRKSHRPVAHARKLDLWAIHDEAAARAWLRAHPDLDPPTAPLGVTPRPRPNSPGRAFASARR